MAQWENTQAVLLENPGSVPSTQMWLTTVFNSSCRGSEAHFWLPQVPSMYMVQTHMQTNSYTLHEKKKKSQRVYK